MLLLRRRTAATVAVVAAAVSAGCSAAALPDDGGSERRVESLGVVQIERRVAVDGAAREIYVGAFARYHGVPVETVEELIGVAPLGAIDRCEDAGPTHVGRLHDGADVELLDVGTLRIVAGAEPLALEPRTFPDLASVVGGAFYAGDRALGVAAHDDTEVALFTEGSADVGAVDVVALAPRAPERMTFDGEALHTALLRSGRVELAWDAGDARDRVFVEFRSARGVTRCALADDGRELVELELPGEGPYALRVERVRVQPIDVAGVDEAYVRLVASSSFDAP